MRILNIKRNEAPGLQCQRLLFIWIYIGNDVWSTYRVGLVIFPSKRMALDCPSTTAKKNGRLKDSCRGTPASGVFSRTSAPPDISNTTLLTTCRGNTEPVNGDDHSTQSVESWELTTHLLTWSTLKGLAVLSRLNSASEPRSLASISGFMFVSRSRMSLVNDKENCGRDSSNKLGRWTQGLFDLGRVGKIYLVKLFPLLYSTWPEQRYISWLKDS